MKSLLLRTTTSVLPAVGRPMGRLRAPFTLASAVAIACVLLLGAGAEGAEEALKIENLTTAPRDASTAFARFDISWDKSWRDGKNHDAAWVFFKVRAEDKSEWQHVRLAADKVLNPAAFGQAEGGTKLDFIVPDGGDGFTGMFIRRAERAAPGKLEARGVTVVWDLAANKGLPKDIKGVGLRAMGMEMVYVAEGPFSLGSGGAEVNGFYMYTDGSQHTQPYRVTRYRLRLPLAALGLEPGAEFGFNLLFFDDDDKGQCYWLQLAPGLARGPARGSNTALYPRFLLQK